MLAILNFTSYTQLSYAQSSPVEPAGSTGKALGTCTRCRLPEVKSTYLSQSRTISRSVFIVKFTGLSTDSDSNRPVSVSLLSKAKEARFATVHGLMRRGQADRSQRRQNQADKWLSKLP